jgi:hypothetical protein
MNSEIIPFTESAQAELKRLYDELQIGDIVDALRNGSLPEETQALIVPLTTTILDLFGQGTPTIGIDPISTLKSASRDINLSRILRERGIFRLFRLLNTNDDHNVPLFHSLTDPDTGAEFTRREDMIGWFCKSAKVSRSLVFMRLGTIEKLLGLGWSLDDCYHTLLTKEYAIRETLLEVAEWHSGELDYVDPGIAARLAEKFLTGEEQAQVFQLVDIIADPAVDKEEKNDAQDRLTDAVRPAITKLVQEVAAHDDVKGAMEFVRNDIAGKPEISYSWDYERGELVQEVIIKGNKDGDEYIKEIKTNRFVPEMPVVPQARLDLTTRLPIRNRMKEL